MNKLNKHSFPKSNVEMLFQCILVGMVAAILLILVLYILGFLFGWAVICDTDEFLQDFGFWHTVWHGFKFFWGYILGFIIGAILTVYWGAPGSILGVVILILLGLSVQ